MLGHEPVGVIDALGDGLEPEYHVGQRVIVGAITPCGQCFYCLNANHSQCGGPLGGWRFGNTIDGAWAEYLLVPDARANLAPIPDTLTDEKVVLLADIFSTGLSGAESGGVKIGDAVAVFAQGPIGLCATLGAKLRGAALIIGVDSVPARLEMARRFGADVRDQLRGAGSGRRDQAPHRRTAASTWRSRRSAARKRSRTRCARIRPGGTLSSLGVYSGKLVAPYEPFYAGLGDQRIVTTLCPGGKERMRRLMEIVAHGRIDLSPLLTHRFVLDDIEEAFDLFSHQRDGVMKVALHPAIEVPELVAAGGRSSATQGI